MKAPYSDRREAGELLAAYVAPLVNGPAVVAAIPRGGSQGEALLRAGESWPFSGRNE